MSDFTFRLLLSLVVLAMLAGTVWLCVVSGVDVTAGMPAMPWSDHYGDPSGCWDATARHGLYLQGRLDTFDWLYCQGGHA